MRLRHSLALVAGLCVLAGVAIADRPADPASMFDMEKRFGDRALTLWGDDRWMFVVLPRAFYVDNFGLLMTSEMNLAPGPGTALLVFGGRPLTKPQVLAHKKTVLERVPKLREFLKTELLEDAAFFPALPDEQRLGIAVKLYHFAWEDTADIPTEIVVQATKKSLTAARGNATLRDQSIEMKDIY